MSSTAAEELLLDVLGRHVEGCSNATLEAEIPGTSMPVDVRVASLNALLAKRRVNLFKDGDELVYKLVTNEEAARFKNLSAEEALVFQLIQQSADMGIWTKDLKQRSNLQQPQITSCLRQLEKRKLVKAVKSVTNKNRKLYMLFDVEPSREVTGGAWYTEHEFDSEFIDGLRQACLQYITDHSETGATLDLLCKVCANVSNVALKQDEVLQIVNTLVYDGTVDVSEQEDEEAMCTGTLVYKPAALAPPDYSYFTNVPCGVCPVFNDCSDDGLITPRTCTYFDQHLNF
mmetsp:Transcript_7062/g.23398  ORF Transcript_7062/g.23398 Transcript_7062/m.23398 type:complete len:287 (+) Transcript_7062:1175-2035(+)